MSALAPWENAGSAGVSRERYENIGDVQLACGRTLPGVTVAYETYGKLREGGDNAVLVCHALSGDSHIAGFRPGEDPDDGKPGWWDIMVGPGKAIDTDHLFVVCSNVLGGCSGSTGPGSIDPRTDTPYGLRFPLVTVEDMVEVQAKLLDSLGVKRLASVVGGSMGGMQALAWAKRYPERVRSVVADATTPRLGAQAIAFNEVGRQAILTDPHFAGGDYYGEEQQPDTGLAIARMVGHITYLSDTSMRAKFGRRLSERVDYAYDFVHEFEVETYLAHQGRRFVERFDANTYLYMTKAMDYFDLTAEAPSLAESLRGTQARWLVLSFSSDWLFPTASSLELVAALQQVGADVTYAEIPSPYGHDAFLLEPAQQHAYVAPFLARVAEEAVSR
ncbi:MAG TPA: homoserine O-acetyltransferase [Coriobacteriia bacterium]|jgi:homoserine O-acetyltransferase